MGLKINHNISAMTSHRAMVNNDAMLSKSLERLSTGLRINKAADDAAGLAISEKLRTQIRGLNRASLNIQDGISLIQTAEGALDQTQGILQRMRELAIQSSNDTLTSSDRLEIQKEVEQLKDQIDQIANTTEFNTKKLLDGSSTAVISTSAPKNLEVIAMGSIASPGDFSIAVNANGENAGVAEKQRSNIFTKTNGSIASSTTTLQSIAAFTNASGHFILDLPQELYLIADNQQSHFTVSKDLTLGQVAGRISIAMNSDLGIKSSTVKVTTIDDTVTGSLETTAGYVGERGRINFSGSEDLIKAFGFGQTVKAQDAVYTIKATRLDQSTVETVSTKISGNRASNLVQGIDLKFIPGLSASIAGSIKATHGVSIDSATDLEFHVTDTDGTSIGLILYNDSAVTTINGTTIAAPANGHKGRYSAGQIVSFFNQAASGNYTDPTASIHHFLATSKATPLNASVAFAVGPNASFHFGLGRLSFRVGDGVATTTVSLTTHFNSSASVAAAINASLTGAGVKISVGTNGNKLRFYQKAGATKVSVVNIAGAGNNLTVDDGDNLRKLGFSFAGAGVSTATSFIESAFIVPGYDFSSIAGRVGPFSFAISQSGSPVNIVLREDVTNIAGLVSTINQQLIAANSGVRAGSSGNILNFTALTGPARFQVQDLGAVGSGLFASTRTMTKIHFPDATNTTSAPPLISQRAQGGDSNYSLRAALRTDGNISFYYLTELGSASRITVSVRQGGVNNKLGLVNGRTSGTGGTQAVAKATTAVSQIQFGNGVTGGSIVLRLFDQHYDVANNDNYMRLSFSGNGTYKTSVIKNAFNQQLAQQDSDARVSIGSNGTFQFYTRGGGAVAKVSVREYSVAEGFTKTAGQDMSLAAFGFTVTALPVPNIKASGTNGNGAKGAALLGTIQKADRLYGFNLGDFNTGSGDSLNFTISDGTTTSGSITVNEGELSMGTAFYTGQELASIFETRLNTDNVKVTASYDSSNKKIVLKSDDIGTNSKIHILETSPGSNTLNGVFGIVPDSYSGTGDTTFKVHIKENTIKFHIGANESQNMASGISRMDTIALGVSKVDMTNATAANNALTALDHALDVVSSERAKLGAIQNRLEYTKSSVDISSENLSAAESTIRDVDFAKEVVEQTRHQILLQSSTAQLAQANTSNQTVLQLLGR